MPEGNASWHREVVTQAVEQTLLEVKESSSLAGFYLAGGTGLALHLGHRRSHDLIFFTSQPLQPEAAIEKLQRLPGFSVTARSEGTLHVLIRATRVSFLRFAYPLLFPPANLLGIEVADPRDIACMKINAIAGRGTKRDFVDLFAVCQQYALADLMGLFKKKFAQANYSLVHVAKSLAYFDDAEKDPMPEMLVPLDWAEVKKFVAREATRLV